MCGETAAAVFASRKPAIPTRNKGLRRNRRVGTISRDGDENGAEGVGADELTGQALGGLQPGRDLGQDARRASSRWK